MGPPRRWPQLASGSALDSPWLGGKANVSWSLQSTATDELASLYAVGTDASRSASLTRPQRVGGCAVGVLFGQGAHNEGEGVFDLAIGEQVPPALGCDLDAQAVSLDLVQGHEGPMDAGEVSGTLVA